MLKVVNAALVGCAFFAASAASAVAGREPNPEELQRIEETLRSAGYVSWQEIELDDGVWEVDDARRAGRSRDCDVDISPRTYQIVREDCD